MTPDPGAGGQSGAGWEPCSPKQRRRETLFSLTKAELEAGLAEVEATAPSDSFREAMARQEDLTRACLRLHASCETHDPASIELGGKLRELLVLQQEMARRSPQGDKLIRGRPRSSRGSWHSDEGTSPKAQGDVRIRKVRSESRPMWPEPPCRASLEKEPSPPESSLAMPERRSFRRSVKLESKRKGDGPSEDMDGSFEALGIEIPRAADNLGSC